MLQTVKSLLHKKSVKLWWTSQQWTTTEVSLLSCSFLRFCCPCPNITHSITGSDYIQLKVSTCIYASSIRQM